MEEGHDVECVTEMMRLFSAAQQRRVNVVTCILVHRHKATSQEGVTDEFPPLLVPSCQFLHVFVSLKILDCNSLLLTIQFPDTLTPEVQSAIQKLLLVIFQEWCSAR